MRMHGLDPRPYAAPTDLVTAADVARWLHEIDDDDITGGDPMWLTISRLDARLDRERRQACRRGARYEITMARAFWRAGGGVQQMLALAHVQCAIAFRAAARQP